MKLPGFVRDIAATGAGGAMPAQSAREQMRQQDLENMDAAKRAELQAAYERGLTGEYKKGGSVKRAQKAKRLPSTKSASSRADGIAVKGKTRGRYI